MSTLRILSQKQVVDNMLNLREQEVATEAQLHNRPKLVYVKVVDRRTGERAHVTMSIPYYNQCILEQQTL